jgi:hypothetical protein
MDGAQPFGPDEAQVGVGIAGPSLRCFKIRAAGWVMGHISFLGRAGISCWARFGLIILSVFSISENSNEFS